MTQTSKYPLGGARCCRRLEQRLRPSFFGALADSSRLALLCQLAACGRACSVSELATCCPIDLSVVSRHLKVLRDAGLVRATREGRRVHYEVDFDLVVGTLRTVADEVDRCRRPRC